MPSLKPTEKNATCNLQITSQLPLYPFFKYRIVEVHITMFLIFQFQIFFFIGKKFFVRDAFCDLLRLTHSPFAARTEEKKPPPPGEEVLLFMENCISLLRIVVISSTTTTRGGTALAAHVFLRIIMTFGK